VKRTAALLSFLVLAVAAPSAAAAEFGIVPGSVTVSMLDTEGNPENLSGSHPDRLQIGFAMSVAETGTSARNIAFELPPGFGGNPAAVPQCPQQAFNESKCPPTTQVGTITLKFSEGGGTVKLPIFQLEPKPGEVAAFGMNPALEVPFTMELRPTDFGLTFKADDLPQTVAVEEGQVELWGVPADHQEGGPYVRRPFLTAPTLCGPMAVTFRARSWQEGAEWQSVSADTGTPLGGCDELSFEPKLGLTLSNPAADSPTGAGIDLSVPEDESPDGRASAKVKDLTLELPEGLTVSPGGAQALSACSDAQLGLGTTTEVSCPPSSKVGTVEIALPALPEPLGGALYLGQEHPGERLRMFVVASGLGAVVKFVGSMRADPSTGRLSMTLSNLPQVPIGRISLNIGGGSHALLASPLECGPATAVGSFVPNRGGAPVQATATVAVGGNAPGSPCTGRGPFAPTLEVASSSVRAGRPTNLSVRLRRRDGEQQPGRFAVTLPAGLSAIPGKTAACPDAALSSGACPAESRVGGVFMEVGSGPEPAPLRGDVYLTGPYRRSPFGLLLVFRAAIGPFNFGTIAVRAAMQISPETGRVTVTTDRLPATVEGLQVRIRTFALDMDRQGFLLNPTSCAPSSVDATIESTVGSSAIASSRFAASQCDKLGFKPGISMTLSDRSELHRHGHPGLTVSARMRPGDASLRGMNLLLPRILKFELSSVAEICARRDALHGSCPSGAGVGAVIARTPMLNSPLKGSMYAVQPQGEGLPDLWLSVEALGVRINLKSETSLHKGHFAIKLAGLPDVPMSGFTIRTRGGDGGAFYLGSRLCVKDRAHRLASPVVFKGQNGARRKRQIQVKANPPCKQAKKPSQPTSSSLRRIGRPTMPVDVR
jgi:hypothetical protein